MTQKPDAIEQLAHVMGDMTLAAVSGQVGGLNHLLAEMQALAQVLPAGLPHHSMATDAEVEAEFDNMPV